MEALRRIALLGGVLLGIWLALSVSSEPLMAIKNVNIEEEQEHLGGSYLNEEERRLRELPLEEFQAHLFSQAVPAGEGRCSEFLVKAASASRLGGGALSDRLSKERFSRNPYVFFSSDEIPAGCLSGQIEEFAGGLVSTGDEKTPLVEVKHYPVSTDNFRLGTGYGSYPAPPSSLLYPRRSLGYLLILTGLVAYILLPRGKRDENEAGYAMGRVVAGDIVGIILLAMFFALPMFIVGGAQPVFTVGLPLVVVMWFLACFGLVIILLGAHHASFRIRLKSDGMVICKLLGRRNVSFASIQKAEVRETRPPKWLRRGLWIAASASGNLTAAGMAVLQSSSRPLRLVLDMGKGRSERIWLTDQTGTPILRNIEFVLSGMADAGVPGAKEIIGKWLKK